MGLIDRVRALLAFQRADELSQELDAKLLKLIRQKFTSFNSIPVERISVHRDEVEIWIADMERRGHVMTQRERNYWVPAETSSTQMTGVARK